MTGKHDQKPRLKMWTTENAPLLQAAREWVDACVHAQMHPDSQAPLAAHAAALNLETQAVHFALRIKAVK